SVGGNDAGVMNHFLHDADEALALDDLKGRVVAYRHHGRSFETPGDAALRQRTGLRAVPLMFLLKRTTLSAAFGSVRSQRRHASFGSGDDRGTQAGGPLYRRSTQTE